MNNFHRHVAVIAFTLGAIGFMLICFMAYKIYTLSNTVGYLNRTVSSIKEELSGLDFKLNE